MFNFKTNKTNGKFLRLLFVYTKNFDIPLKQFWSMYYTIEVILSKRFLRTGNL